MTGSAIAPHRINSQPGWAVPRRRARSARNLLQPACSGAIEVGRKLVSLTDLGVRLADAHQEMEARVDAFLNVPLYLRVYEDNLGRKLPGDKGLENMMKELGVSPKQLNKARIVFRQRSAEQAGSPRMAMIDS